jgi:hypothetical protein
MPKTDLRRKEVPMKKPSLMNDRRFDVRVVGECYLGTIVAGDLTVVA